jgi:hypothetical protein
MLNPMVMEMATRAQTRDLKAEYEARRLRDAARVAKGPAMPGIRHLLKKIDLSQALPRIGYAPGVGPYPLGLENC